MLWSTALLGLCFSADREACPQIQFVPAISAIAGNGTAGGTGDGGQATRAQLDLPTGVAFDRSGNVFVVESEGCRVRKVTVTTAVITTVAGNGVCNTSGDGGPAIHAELTNPARIAVDSEGNLYISDTGGNRVRRVTEATGVITTIAGNGTAGFSGDGGAGTSAELSSPTGLVLDGFGNLYIADTGNNRIRLWTASSGNITTYAGGAGPGFFGDGGPAVSARLNNPSDVALDDLGNLYISDTLNNRIREVTASTGQINTVAGGGNFGNAGFSGDGGAATIAQLNAPAGIAVDVSGNLYIADSGNNRLRQVNGGTGTVSTFVGTGTSGLTGNGAPAALAEISLPSGVGLDGWGNLYFADESNHELREVRLGTSFPNTNVGGRVLQTYLFELTAADSISGFTVQPLEDGKQEFSVGTITGCHVHDSAINPIGTLCKVPVMFRPLFPGVRHVPLTVATGGGTLALGLTGTGFSPLAALTPGIISTVVGTGTAGYTKDGVDAWRAKLHAPQRAVLDQSGNLFIADTANNMVRKVDHASGSIRTVAGTSAAGYWGDGGSAASAGLNAPFGIGIDSADNLYIADRANHRIRKVTSATGIITTVVGTGKSGFSGDGGLASIAEISSPAGSIAFDRAGNFYFADSGNNRVREVIPQTGLIRTVAGNGIAGNAGDGAAATAAELNNPLSVAVDSAGNLFIADPGNDRVREVAASTGIITTYAGNGEQGYAGDGGAATSAQLAFPSGLAIDAAGDVYIADSKNHCIRMVNAVSGVINTVAGNAIGGYSGDGRAATMAEMDAAFDIALDSAGNLFITDPSNNVIREVRIASSEASFAMSTPVGTRDGTDNTQRTMLSNIGNTALTLSVLSGGSNPTVPAFFDLNSETSCPEVQYDSSPGTLASGANCIYAVDFAPTAAGDVSETLVLTDDSLNVPGTVQTIRMTGRASRGVPTIKWTTPSTIPYGAPLTSAHLNATASVAGTFAYSPPAGTILAPGLRTLTVTFTPTNKVNYKTATLSVFVNVDQPGTAIIASENAELAGERSTPPTVKSMLAAPTTTLGLSSTTQTATLTLSASGTLGSISVLTQGAANQDFQVASGGSCAVGTAYTSGQTCTVNFTFTPLYPGLRLGGILLKSDASAWMGTTYLSGTGTGPLVSITPGLITTFAGNGTGGYTGNGGLATNAEIYDPAAIATDGAGNLYIADRASNTVSKIAVSTGIITTIAGTGSPGFSGDGGTATSAKLNNPEGVAIDGVGNVYISDLNNNRVRVISEVTGLISTFAGNGTAGYGGDGGAATSAELNGPVALALDSSGNLYIGDYLNNCVREVNIATGHISTIAGNGTGGYTGDGIAATSAEINGPRGLVVDSSGNVYVSDYWNHRVRKITFGTGLISTIAGTGSSGYTGDGGAATSAKVNGPWGLVQDPAGNFYIGDNNNHAVRFISAATGKISTVAGNGTAAYAGDGAGATSAELHWPEGVWIDPTGNLYIADAGNNRVREVSVGGALSYPTSTVVMTSDTTDSTKTATVQNIGNATLTVSVPASGSNPTLSPNFGLAGATTCPQLTNSSSAVTFASGAACTYGVNFAPIMGQTTPGSLVLTDDSLNAAVSTQTISLIATATEYTPTITWATPASLRVGQPLSATQLNANSGGVAGTFVYTPAIGTYFSAGTQTLSVTFTPANTAYYYSVTQTVSLTMLPKITPTITWAAPSAVAYGATLSSTQLDASASVGGTYLYAPAAGTVLVAGTQSLSVTFTPTDTVDYNSVTQTVSLTVSQATPTVILSSANPTTVYGTPVTLTAVLPVAATGTVLFYDGATTIGTASVVSGAATMVISSLAGGIHTITASYSGDSNYNASASAAWTQTISKSSITIAMASSLNPSLFGDSVTVTVVFIGTLATPTGNATLLDGSTTLSTLTLNGTGVAVYNSPALDAGSHNLSIAYSGDGNYQ